jgi:UPF0042 nucleotide-binding protein
MRVRAVEEDGLRAQGAKRMRFVVISGMSGAGKTLALHSFEDAGYYAVDNLPPRLLPALTDYCRAEGCARAAAVVDTRCGPTFAELPDILHELSKAGVQVETLFLDASDETLVHRYKETRRPHPLLRESEDGVMRGDIVAAIQEERHQLEPVRALVDRMLDTTALSIAQLRDTLHATYAPDTRPGLLVTVTSFGFKHGLPVDADLVFDVRFLTNPHYVSALKPFTGMDARVVKYVHDDPHTLPFLEKMFGLIAYALPQYQLEGKAYLNIAIGCTGGKHRSVVLAEDLAERLRAEQHRVAVRHRDIYRTSDPSLQTKREEDLL